MASPETELPANQTREEIARRREMRRPLIHWWVIFPIGVALVLLFPKGVGFALMVAVGCAIHLVNFLHRRRLSEFFEDRARRP